VFAASLWKGPKGMMVGLLCVDNQAQDGATTDPKSLKNVKFNKKTTRADVFAQQFQRMFSNILV